MLNHEILQRALGPVNTPERLIQHQNFFVKGKVSGLAQMAGAGHPVANPGHAAATLPFAAAIDNTIPYPSEAGPTVSITAELVDKFPGITNPSIDGIRLVVGGPDAVTRGISVRIRVTYSPGGASYQESSVAFIMDQGPVIIYIFTLRRQGGRLYLTPISADDGLEYHVDSAPADGIQGSYADISYMGVTLSDPIFAAELAEFGFGPVTQGDNCATKSSNGKGRRSPCST